MQQSSCEGYLKPPSTVMILTAGCLEKQICILTHIRTCMLDWKKIYVMRKNPCKQYNHILYLFLNTMTVLNVFRYVTFW